MKPRIYRAFGLNLLSEVEMPHWPLAEGAPDVQVKWGTVPESLPDATELWGTFWGRKGICLLNYRGVGRMLVESGCRVTCALPAEGNPHALGAALSGVGIAAVLFQRNLVVLHASAAAKDGRAVLIMGPSGSGKSTTLCALLQRGYQLLSDDLTVVTLRRDGTADAMPSFPTVRLHRDSLHALQAGNSPGVDLESVDGKQRRRFDEYFAHAPVRIERCCRLLCSEGSAPASETVPGVQRFVALQDNLYRRRMARILGDPQHLDAVLMALAQRVEMRRIWRPRAGFDLEALCHLVTG